MPRKNKQFSFASLQKGLNQVEKRQTAKIAKKAVRRELETKHHDEAGTGTEVSTTAQIVDLTTISRGDTGATFDGDSLTPVGFEFRQLLGVPTGQTALNICRVILFIWKMDDTDEVPVVGDILYDTTNVPYLSRVLWESKKFKVLSDRTYEMGPTSTPGGLPQNRVNIISVKPKKLMKMYFKAAASTGRNKIYLMTIGNVAAGVSDANIFYHSSLRFKG